METKISIPFLLPQYSLPPRGKVSTKLTDEVYINPSHNFADRQNFTCPQGQTSLEISELHLFAEQTSLISPFHYIILHKKQQKITEAIYDTSEITKATLNFFR